MPRRLLGRQQLSGDAGPAAQRLAQRPDRLLPRAREHPGQVRRLRAVQPGRQLPADRAAGRRPAAEEPHRPLPRIRLVRRRADPACAGRWPRAVCRRDPGLLTGMKRYLYRHRWLGIARLFVLAWVVSGVVMLFVGYPKLTPEEHLAPGTAADCCIAPRGACRQRRSAHPAQPAPDRCRRLAAALPAGLATDRCWRWMRAAVGASSAFGLPRHQPVRGSSRTVLTCAARSGREMPGRATMLARERPLYRLQADDAEGRLLYVSSQRAGGRRHGPRAPGTCWAPGCTGSIHCAR